jgi:hypothetical protein
MSGKVTLGEVKAGAITLVDLCKLNSLLDFQAASERLATEKARSK